MDQKRHRKSYTKLAEMLHKATTYVAIGGHYRYYKEPMTYYTVTGFSVMKQTDEIVVRYTSSENPKIEFVLPISFWLGLIQLDGRQVARYRKIS